MKIVWILVILIIIGVAVFAIRKQIGAAGETEEKESNVIATSEKQNLQTQIKVDREKTFEEKLADIYSGKITPEQLDAIRADKTLSPENRDKVEFEVIMKRFWPERIAARVNGGLYWDKWYGYTDDEWRMGRDGKWYFLSHQANIFPTPIDALFIRLRENNIIYPNSQFMADNSRLWEMFHAYKWVSEDIRVRIVLADNNL